MQDERLNLPSASALERLDKCHGSFHLAAQCPNTTGVWGEIGDRVHAWLRGEIPGCEMPPEQLETGQQCRAQADQAIEEWMRQFSLEDCTHSKSPGRLWLRKGLRPIFSGECDEIHWTADRMLIIDFKSLWGKHPDTEENLQLRGYAVLAHAQWPHLESVSVALIAPKTSGVRLCTYTSSDLETARKWLLGVLEKLSPNAPLNPGPHCRWCPASLTARCPVLQLRTLALAQTSLIGEDGTREGLSDDDLAALLDKCGAVKRFIAEVEAEGTRRVEAGRKLVFGDSQWVLEPGDERRKVTDTLKAYQSLQLDTEEFIEACSVKVSDLDKAYHRHRKAREPRITQKTAREEMNTLLKDVGAMEVNANKPSLERVKLLKE